MLVNEARRHGARSPRSALIRHSSPDHRRHGRRSSHAQVTPHCMHLPSVPFIVYTKEVMFASVFALFVSRKNALSKITLSLLFIS